MRAPDAVVPLDRMDDGSVAAWESLCVRERTGYFTAPAWCTSWADALAPDGRTEVATWAHDGALVAVAAMTRAPEPLVPGRAGRLLAVPRWQNTGSGPGSGDHLGFPASADLRRDALGWALSLPGTVRLLHLADGWAPLLPAGRGVERLDVRTYATDLDGSPRPGSKKLWKHIARSRRQLTEQGVTFDHLLGRDIGPTELSALFALHGVRSAAAGRTTTFTGDRRRFHELLAARSTADHAPLLVRATGPGGRLVGALYGFVDPTTVHYYQSGWDPAYERWSLGSVLIGEAVDLAVDRGAATFDLLRGDEPYKLRFGARVVEDRSVTVHRGAGGLALRTSAGARHLAARALAARRRRREAV